MSNNHLMNAICKKHTGHTMPVHWELLDKKDCPKVIKYRAYNPATGKTYTGWMWKDALKRAAMCGYGRLA